MFIKKIKFILILLLLYQTPSNSKSTSFNHLDSKNLSKYFSGIVAFENKDNSAALEFFNSSKILINRHDPYLRKYISSLVLQNKVPQAIGIIKQNLEKENSNFFDAHLLLIIDSLKKNNFDKAFSHLLEADRFTKQDKFSLAILESLKQYVYVFKEKEFLDNKKNFGKLSIISETFQKCYLGDPETDTYFSKLINNTESDFTRYIYFYLTFLIENDRLVKAKEVTNNIQYINTTLLLSQAKSWIQNKNSQK